MKRTVLPTNARLVPLEAKRVFKGVIYDVYHWQQTMFDGSQEIFEMLKRPDTVKVIAIKDDKLVVLEQQQPDSDVFYDVPGGRHDQPDETEFQAAQRELREETGLEFADWRLLEVTQPHGKIDYFVYVFLASILVSENLPVLDVGEKISVLYLSMAEVEKLFDAPNARYLPKNILSKIDTIDDLLKLPAADDVKNID